MSTATMAAMPQEAIQQGSTQPETTKPDKYSISTAEALREGYSVPEPVPETVSCKYCGRKLEYYGLVSPVAAATCDRVEESPGALYMQQGAGLLERLGRKGRGPQGS